MPNLLTSYMCMTTGVSLPKGWHRSLTGIGISRYRVPWVRSTGLPLGLTAKPATSVITGFDPWIGCCGYRGSVPTVLSRFGLTAEPAKCRSPYAVLCRGPYPVL